MNQESRQKRPLRPSQMPTVQVRVNSNRAAPVSPSPGTDRVDGFTSLPDRQETGLKSSHIGILVLAGILVVFGLMFAATLVLFWQFEDYNIQRGQFEMSAGRWADAEILLRQTAQMQPSFLLHHYAQSMALLGETQFHLGKLDEALQSLNRAQAFDPGVTIPYATRAEIFLAKGQIDAALADAQIVRRQDDHLALPYAIDAYYQNLKHDPGAALQAANAALERDPHNLPALRLRAILLVYQDDLHNSLVDLETLLKIAPQDTQALALRVYANLRRHYQAQAQVDLDRLLAVNKTNPDALWALAMMKAFQYDHAAARSLIDAAIASDPKRPEFYVTRAESTLLSSQYAQQIADYDQALTLDPDFVPALAGRAKALAEHYEKIDLQAAAQLIHKIAPGSLESYRLLAMQQIRQQQLAAALDSLNQAAALQPAIPETYLDRAGVQILQHNDSEAVKDLAKTIRLDHNFVPGLTGLARFYTLQDQFAEAQQSLDSALSLDPQAVEVYTTQALLFSRQNQPEKARAALDKALALDPARAMTWTLSARWFMDQKEPGKAREAADTALQKLPAAPYASITRGSINLAGGDSQQARADAYQALQADPESPEAFILLAKTYLADRDYRTAAQMAEIAVRGDPWNMEAAAALGEAYSLLGSPQKAVETYQKALKLDEKQLQLVYPLAMAQRSVGNYAGALLSIEHLLRHSSEVDPGVIRLAENERTFLKSVPSLLNGTRTYTSSSGHFQLSVLPTWLPVPLVNPGKNEVLDFVQQDPHSQAQFRIWNQQFAGGYPDGMDLNLLLDNIESELNAHGGYHFLKRSLFQAGETSGMTDSFTARLEDQNGGVKEVEGKLYVFYHSGHLTWFEYSADPASFKQFEGQSDQIAASFRWL